jgi:hypothetical protein
VEAQPCKFCLHPRTNLCQAVRAWTGRGVMKADNASRFTYQGKPVFHFMGTSTFSEYTGARAGGRGAKGRRRQRAALAGGHVHVSHVQLRVCVSARSFARCSRA